MGPPAFLMEPPAFLQFLGVKDEDQFREADGRDRIEGRFRKEGVKYYVIMSDRRWNSEIGKWQTTDSPKDGRMAILEKEGK